MIAFDILSIPECVSAIHSCIPEALCMYVDTTFNEIPITGTSSNDAGDNLSDVYLRNPARRTCYSLDALKQLIT